MGNIKNYNFNNLKLKLNNSDYWDFYLANDGDGNDCDTLLSGSCFVIWYDFNNPLIYSGDSIYSLVYWTGATNNGYELNTIGLTGIDNGLVTFDKLSGDTSNDSLLSALTTSVLVINSGDTRMVMNSVSGSCSGLTYNILTNSGETEGNFVDLMGGFYQGFYKLDGYDYEVLPNRVNHSWSGEFWVKPYSKATSGVTLNDIYPNNKGIFFYMGTRAENKFWNEWYGSDTGCTSGCTSSACTSGETVSTWCTIPKEVDVMIVGDYGVGIPLSPPQIKIELITNEFLIYGRGSGNRNFITYTGATGSIEYEYDENHEQYNVNCRCSRCTGPQDGLGYKRAGNYDGNGLPVGRIKMVEANFNNPFLVYGRASKSGCGKCVGPQDGFGNETVASFSGFSKPQTELDYNLDIIDNALGFRIKDDGSIGYRLLTVTGGCQTINGERKYISGITIEEKYSMSGLVSFDEWNYIVVKFITDYKTDCELKSVNKRKGKLMFYINGKLKYVIEEFDEFVARRLDEYKDKQIGVPFNFSIGGGSQGLIESQTFGGLDYNDRGLPIQTNFSGSFIGGLGDFKFNICDLKYCNIQLNYLNGITKYNQTNLLLQENDFYIYQEDGYSIIL